MRVFGPTMRENMRDGVSVDETLRQVERNARLLGAGAGWKRYASPPGAICFLGGPFSSWCQ